MEGWVSKMTNNQDLTELISQWACGINVSGKMGKKVLQPSLANSLRLSGYLCDEEDQSGLLKGGMPVWRNKNNGEVEPTISRRRIDIIVYRQSRLVALIETESDLNDLRASGVTRRNGHYDVASIARSSCGTHFDSYKSLERMASAAFFWNQSVISGRYPLPAEATAALEAIKSDDSADHNPAGIPLYLITGASRFLDSKILAPRLRSLSAHLISVLEARD